MFTFLKSGIKKFRFDVERNIFRNHKIQVDVN